MKLHLAAILLLSSLPVRAATLTVAPNGNDANPGTAEQPLATLQRARDLLRAQGGDIAGVEKKIVVRAGTYFLSAPLHLTGADAGLKIEGEAGARPVISGGRAIGGWQKAEGNLWKARVPQDWDFRSMRAGDAAQTLARTPNLDPANRYLGGWSFVAKPPLPGGAFGAALGRIHTAGDWIEWHVSVPAAGDYAMWMRYAAFNKAFGNDDMAERTQIQIDGGPPGPLNNLPDTGGWNKFKWSKVATLPLKAGDHVLRWTNLRGGGLNWDAFALTDDADFTPPENTVKDTTLKARAGKNLIVVQAEVFSKAQSKEMTVPEETVPSYLDHFTFKARDVPRFPRSPDAEVHIFPAWGWVNAILQVDRVDYDKKELWFKQTKSASQELRVGNRYYLSNIFEGLDAPGEWWLDKKNATVYWWPENADAVQQPIVAPVLDRLIEIHNTHNVALRGLEFRDTGYSLDTSVYEPQDATLWMSGAKDCTIENNRFIGVGGYALRLENRSANNEFVGNEVAWNGQGGVILLGNNDTQPQDNLIAGNWMHHLGQVYKHVAGAYCTTASGTRVAHNRFEFLPRYAIAFKSYGPDAASHRCVAEYNDMFATSLETNNAGAIETLGRDKEDSANLIQYNRIFDVVGLKAMPDGKLVMPFMTWGIYLNDYSSGTTVRGNVVARHEWGGTCVRGGKNNLIENNVFVDGGIHQVWFDPIDEFSTNNRFTRNIVVYSSLTADLIKLTRRTPQQVLAASDFNVFYHDQGKEFLADKPLTPLGLLAQWNAAGFDLNSDVADPQFLDAANDDFRLELDSPALKLGFTPLPWDKIGLEGYDRAWKTE